MQFLGGGRGGMRAWGGKSAPGPFPREGDTAKPPPRFVRAVRALTKPTTAKIALINRKSEAIFASCVSCTCILRSLTSM